MAARQRKVLTARSRSIAAWLAWGFAGLGLQCLAVNAVGVVVEPGFHLYHAGLLPSWQVGDDTVQTLFKTNLDFYFSFSIGLAGALVVVGGWNAYKGIRSLRRRLRERAAEGAGPAPGLELLACPKGGVARDALPAVVPVAV